MPLTDTNTRNHSDDDGLSRQDYQIIQEARGAMIASIVEQTRGRRHDVIMLAAIACSGAFADVCTTMQLSAELVDLINRQIVHAGLRLVTVPPN